MPDNVTLTTAAWSSDVGPTTFSCPVQCVTGRITLNWEASAPGSIRGLRMAAEDVVILPAGTTFRFAKDPAAQEAVVFYEEFPA